MKESVLKKPSSRKASRAHKKAKFRLNPVKQFVPAVIEGIWLKYEALCVLWDEAVGVLAHGAEVHEPEHGLDKISLNLPVKLNMVLGYCDKKFREIQALLEQLLWKT